MLNEDSYRTQLNDTTVCDCRDDYESVEHFVCECKLNNQHRTVMYEDINEVLQLLKESSGVKISFGLLLGQDWDNRTTRAQNRMTKMSVF